MGRDDDCIVFARGAHIVELLGSCQVDIEIAYASILANDLSFVDIYARRNKELRALLNLEDLVRRRAAHISTNQRSDTTSRKITRIGLEALDGSVEHALAACVRQELAAVTEEPP